MTQVYRYEICNVAEKVVRLFVDGKITDMECLAACRKLKSIYDMINKVRPS